MGKGNKGKPEGQGQNFHTLAKTLPLSRVRVLEGQGQGQPEDPLGLPLPITRCGVLPVRNDKS